MTVLAPHGSIPPTGGGASGILAVLGLPGPTKDLIAAVKGGLPAATFVQLARALRVSERRLADVVGMSASTLARRKRAGGLTPAEGEHVLRIAGLLGLATTVLGDADEAAAWLVAPNVSLGNVVPLDMADTELGAREVDDLLGRIEHDVYS